jgi:hypothetical protein
MRSAKKNRTSTQVLQDGHKLGLKGSFMGRWRLVGWSAAALILVLPLVAMQFTDEVNWDRADFAFAAILIAGTGIAFELAAARSSSGAYRAAVGVALAAAFLLVWINAAVGIIGSEDNPANLMYGAVLAVAIIGAAIARLKPQGMTLVLVATALAQLAVGVVALILGLGLPYSGPIEIMGLSGLFAGLWVMSAWLFRKAARG